MELGVVNHFTLKNDIATSNTFYLEAMAGLILAYQVSNKLSLNIGYHYQLALSNPYVMQDKDLSDRLKVSRMLFGVKYHR